MKPHCVLFVLWSTLLSEMLFYVCYTKSMAFRALVDLSLCLFCRFFLGGVSSLRGFYEKQAGPTEARIGSPSQVTTFCICIHILYMQSTFCIHILYPHFVYAIDIYASTSCIYNPEYLYYERTHWKWSQVCDHAFIVVMHVAVSVGAWQKRLPYSY